MAYSSFEKRRESIMSIMVSKISILNIRIPGDGVKTTVLREDRVARPRFPPVKLVNIDYGSLRAL